jgi:hypothetical protein
MFEPNEQIRTAHKKPSIFQRIWSIVSDKARNSATQFNPHSMDCTKVMHNAEGVREWTT